MLTWRVSGTGHSSIRRWRSRPSALLAKKLLTRNPTVRMGLVKPGTYDFISHSKIPDADQMLLEALIPHEWVSMIRLIGHNTKERSWRLSHNFALLVENLSVTIKVAHTAEHIADGIHAGVHLLFGPL